jgi:hypothetical protein
LESRNAGNTRIAATYDFMPFDFHLLQKSKAEKDICSLSTDPLQKLRLQGKAGELLYPTTPLQNCLHFKADYCARSVGAILPPNASVARAGSVPLGLALSLCTLGCTELDRYDQGIPLGYYRYLQFAAFQLIRSMFLAFSLWSLPICSFCQGQGSLHSA